MILQTKGNSDFHNFKVYHKLKVCNRKSMSDTAALVHNDGKCRWNNGPSLKARRTLTNPQCHCKNAFFPLHLSSLFLLLIILFLLYSYLFYVHHLYGTDGLTLHSKFEKKLVIFSIILLLLLLFTFNRRCFILRFVVAYNKMHLLHFYVHTLPLYSSLSGLYSHSRDSLYGHG